MQQFEKWLNKNKDSLDEITFKLFSDSIRCYKYDIDRPAYLLAYQGMMYHLKLAIINGKKPDGFPEGE